MPLLSALLSILPTLQGRPAPKPPRVHVTSEDLERFGDEERVHAACDEGRLRDE